MRVESGAHADTEIPTACETFISRQSQHTNYQMLINVVTESII